MSSAVTVAPATGPGIDAVPGAVPLRALPPESPRSGSARSGPGWARVPEQGELPVLPALAPLLPTGALRRGVTVTVTGSTSLALALMAGASAAGSWCAVVGAPALGIRAAAEMGVVLERFAVVPVTGPARPQWSTAVAALLDGMDIVAVRPPHRVRGGEARRLAARARERGAVLLSLGEWEGADVRLSASSGCWSGLGDGTGRLLARRVQARATGRGAHARPRDVTLWLPAGSGRVERADPAPEAVPRPVMEAVS